MERIKGLNRYQKSVLIFMTAMALAFTAVYPVSISREGKNLVPGRESGNTIRRRRMSYICGQTDRGV